jgi:uncharacterized protein GlcG (DUF336 family)
MNARKNKPILDIHLAKRAAAAALAHAGSQGWQVAIAVVDDGGRLMYFERNDDVSWGSGAVALAKAESAAAYRRGTLVFDQRLGGGRLAVLGQPHAFPIEGGVPLMLQGHCIGAIGASGALANQDTELCEAGARALTATEAHDA